MLRKGGIMRVLGFLCLQTVLLWKGQGLVSSFATAVPTRASGIDSSSSTSLASTQRCNGGARSDFRRLVASTVIGSTLMIAGPVYADEIGVERDAPTLFTGETLEICKRRGPLGACLETERRTEENDNDKAKAYFKDPSEIIKEKQAAMLRSESNEGNSLIEKLRQQTEDNKEKNNLYVQQKTFENDQSATFGPLDRQVVIMNTDGKTFTLLESPQATRLKKAGFIDDRRQFIKQPTEEDIAAALEPEEGGLASSIKAIFGGSD